MPTCAICQDAGVFEYDSSAGTVVCTTCGFVVDENAIVSDVTFGESGSGAAVVEGSYMGATDVRARASGPRGRQQTTESREQTLANGKRKIAGLANALNLGDQISEAAGRFYNVALTNGFVQGRRGIYVLASCLYVACRMSKAPTMLIDISDLLQVNVFVLGSTYLSMVKDLHLKNIPAIDPSLYISRFASMLEFGEDTQKVAVDATRLVKRFDMDWMSAGRRPAGIAGACLLLAARMNNFRRSVLEIVQVVKIADVTLRKRLEEFKNTPSGKMTVADFRSVWLEEAADPPAFVEGAKKARLAAEEEESMSARSSRATSVASSSSSVLMASGSAVPYPTPDLTAQVLIKGTKRKDHPADGDDDESIPPSESGTENPDELASDRFYENQLDTLIAEDVEAHLHTGSGSLLQTELDERDRRRQEELEAEGCRLDNLDEEEMDGYLMTEEEVLIKTKVWMEFNKDYLEALADRKAREAAGELKPARQRTKRSKTQPRDSSNPSGATAAEAVRKMIGSKKKYSKKINYNIAEALFGSATNKTSATPSFRPPRSGSAVSTAAGTSRFPSRYNTPGGSQAGAVSDGEEFGHQALFTAAPAEEEDDDGDEEEEEEEMEDMTLDADAVRFEMMRGMGGDEEEEEGRFELRLCRGSKGFTTSGWRL